MSSFVNDRDYYFKLVSTPTGVQLRGTNNVNQEIVDLDHEILEYYLQHYTLQKGTFINGFRKILCDDNEERFFGKEHSEYKKAVKAETISIKDIQIGESLMFFGHEELFYIGSFYRSGRNIVKMHTFLNEDTGYIRYFKDLKKFTEVRGYKEKYMDINHNYEKYVKPDNSNSYTSYYLTKKEAE